MGCIPMNLNSTIVAEELVTNASIPSSDGSNQSVWDVSPHRERASGMLIGAPSTKSDSSGPLCHVSGGIAGNLYDVNRIRLITSSFRFGSEKIKDAKSANEWA